MSNPNPWDQIKAGIRRLRPSSERRELRKRQRALDERINETIREADRAKRAQREEDHRVAALQAEAAEEIRRRRRQTDEQIARGEHPVQVEVRKGISPESITAAQRMAEAPITHVEGELGQTKTPGNEHRDKGARPMPDARGIEVRPETVEAAQEAVEAVQAAPQHPREPQPAESSHMDAEGTEWRVHASGGIVFVSSDEGRMQAAFSPEAAGDLALGLANAVEEAQEQNPALLRERRVERPAEPR